MDLNDPFWQGYKRTEEVHDNLLLALDHALTAEKSQRLGQLLVNLKPEGKELDNWLFNVYDEDLIKLLLKGLDK